MSDLRERIADAQNLVIGQAVWVVIELDRWERTRLVAHNITCGDTTIMRAQITTIHEGEVSIMWPRDHVKKDPWDHNTVPTSNIFADKQDASDELKSRTQKKYYNEMMALNDWAHEEETKRERRFFK